MEVHGRADDIDVRRLRGLIAIGHERTIEQDPAFSIRVMVDIAIKALSAAINDPTTAVQVLGYLGEALQKLGRLPHAAWALDTTVAAHFGDSVDFDRARVADRQGLGGPAA